MLVKKRVVIEEPYEQHDKQTAAPPVKKKANDTKPNYFRIQVITAFVVVILGWLLVIANNNRVDTAGYDLVKDRATLTKLQQKNEQLHLELARLKSPERIQTIAKQELGMSVPKTVYYASERPIPASTAAQAPIQKQTPTENIIGMMEGFIKRIIS